MSTHRLLFQWTSTIKIQLSVLCVTKRTSSLSHWKLTCSRHDMAKKLFSFFFFFFCLFVVVFFLLFFWFFLSFIFLSFYPFFLSFFCVAIKPVLCGISIWISVNFIFVLSCHLYLEHENIQGVKRIFDIYKIKLNNTLHMCKICKTYKVIKIPFVEHQEFERKNYIMD